MFLEEKLVKLKESVSLFISQLKSMSVEPAAFFLMTAILANYLVYQNLIMERMCTVELNRTQEDCSAMVSQQKNDSALEAELQMHTSKSRMYRSIIDHSVPLILVTILGYWSDSHGRKFPILLASCHPAAQALALIIFSWQSSVGGYAIGFGSSLVRSFFGGEVVFAMGAYSYLADRTHSVTRTVRMGMLSAGYTLGVPAGISLGGLLIKLKYGYEVCFAICGGIGLIGTLFILLLVDNKVKNNGNEEELTSEKERKSFCKSVMANAKEYVTVLFKKRPHGNRMKILWLIVAFIFTIAPIHGEFGIFYNFCRKMVGWDGAEFGVFTTYKFIVGIAGVVLSMGILSYGLKLSDAIVGFIAGLSQFGGCVVYAIATTPFLMYLAPAVDSMNGTMVVVARSMLSKLVLPSEVGRLFSFLSILEIVVPLFCDPTYSWLYSETLQIFAGSVFVLSAVFTIPPQCVFAVMMFAKAPPRPAQEENIEVGIPNKLPQTGQQQRDKNGITDYNKGNINPVFVHDCNQD